jgi:P pilus assembly chaperone PapD
MMKLPRSINHSPIVLRATRQLVGLAMVAAFPVAARAQFGVDKAELFLNPSVTAQRTGILTVRNEGTVRAQATIAVEDWDRAESGTNRFYEAGTLPQSCARSLRVFPRSLSLAPGEVQTIRVDLDSAADSTLSGRECWSLVAVESAVPQVEPGGRTLLYRLRTGVKVYAMPGNLTTDGQVADVSMHMGTRDSSTASSANDTVEVAFQNTGTKHVIARGRVEVRRPDNSTVAVVELPPAYALPGATMRVRASLPALAVGRYVVLAVLDYGGSEIAAAQLEHEVR